MPPPPLRTCASTVSSSGLRSSRFGPVVPSEPAAASVWQVPQLLAKTAAPSAPPSVVSAVVAAPPESSSSPPQPAAATTRSANTTAMIHTRDRILASFYGGSQTPVSLPRACSSLRCEPCFSPVSCRRVADHVAFPRRQLRERRRRTHTLAKETKMGIIAFIILGFLAGLIAKALLPGDDPGGIIITTLIGVVGAILGGFLAGAIFGADPMDEFFDISSWLTAIVGAMILLVIYRMVAGGTRRPVT